MAVLAITGDIGAGKSTAAKILSEKLSCPLLNADLITAELWRNDKNIKKIFTSRWGNEIIDMSGNIIKSEISRRIFFDKDEYKFCNSILHPLILKELEIRIKELKIKNKNVITEIPLIFEAGGRADFIDKVIYIAADFETRAKRCREQRGWSIDELKRRESFLLPREKKISLSDFVIYNDGNLEDLREKIFVQ